MRNLYNILVLFLFIIHNSFDVFSSMFVKYLPGFEGPLPFELETGYVNLGGEAQDAELFYYFVKSERDPVKDPLMIWLTGGPGCSSISGLLFENGPLAFKGDEYNGTLPPLELTSYSWTKVANIIYLDSPAGTGYSYAKTQRSLKTSDTKQIHQIDQFLRSWFVDHPEFMSNPFYVSGDSYSGLIVPGVVQQISLGNEKGLTPLINIQGYVLGNPLTDMNLESNYRIPFAHRMGLVSDELFQSLEKSCGGKFSSVDPSNAECSNNLKSYDMCISDIFIRQILLPNCKADHDIQISNNNLPNMGTGRRREMNEFARNVSLSLPSPSCSTYKFYLSEFWASNENVRKSLGAKEGLVKWKRCTRSMPYTFDIHNSISYHVNNSYKGFRSLVYSGDHDLVVPFPSTQAWINSLNYYIVDDWRPWMVNSNQVGGYTRTYANKMTFATIKGGGHTAEYTPHECSLMYKRWIDGEPL